jgi:hypothetical protein
MSILQAGLCRELKAVDQAIEYNKDNIGGERFVPGDAIHDALYLERDEILLTLRYHRR